jgi:beta-glucosidase
MEEKASLCLGSDFWHTTSVERLGIPAIMVSDGPHGLRKQPDEADHVGISGSVPATCFPTACALASSWNPRLVGRVGEALGREAWAQGVAVVLGPGINIKRSPLCGRNFEYLSEDPALSGVLGAAMIEGLQSRAWEPPSSTAPPTTRRPTGYGSAPRSTSGRFARSTSPALSAPSPRTSHGR